GQTLRSMFAAADPAPRTGGESTTSPVGGNLLKQLADPRNLRRAARVLSFDNWQTRYFENFAKVPESRWARLFADPTIVSRRRARDRYDEALTRSAAIDPGDKILHWDQQSYLTGLFQQDDRMSMAHGLESRVPLADPRIVRFARQTRFDLKVRSGASKWILR